MEKDFKSFLTSKTIWTNVVAVIAFAIQRKYGFVMDESLQLELLALINIALRRISHKPIRW